MARRSPFVARSHAERATVPQDQTHRSDPSTLVVCTARLIAALFIAALFVSLGTARAQDLREIEHQGIKRNYILVNSTAARDTPRPLLMVLHGRREASAPNRSSPLLDALAAKEEFVAVYPAGLEGRWNFPQQWTEPVKAGSVPADDVGFVLAVIDRLIADKTADAKRVYVSGASNGGLLTYGLMCVASDRIAAAAPLIANMSEAQIAACHPARPVPTVMIAGTADRVMPYDGGLGPWRGRLRSIPETLEFWRKQHGCQTQTVNHPVDPGSARSGRTWRVDWSECRTRSVLSHVRLHRVEGGGHTLPSLTPQTAEDLARNGLRSTDFETSEIVWDFLKQWSLP